MSRFKTAAQNIKETPFVIPITFIFIVMLIISCVTSYEDFLTSKLGYEAMPTRKATALVLIAVSLIPQVGQIGFAYAFGSEVSKQWMMWVALGLHLADVGTDVFFKANGQGFGVWLLAFVESELIFTLGSEIMLVTSVGMLLHLMPDAIEQLSDLFDQLSEYLGGNRIKR